MRAVVMAVAVVLVLVACGSSGSASRSGTTEPASADDGAQVAERGGQAMTSTASCVEEYSLETLPNRRFAFDGTVTGIEPGEFHKDAGAARMDVTYAVHEWFAGGEGSTVTLKSWDFIADGSSGDPALTEGARLLVSGDTDMAWGCGFTRPYSTDEADQWAAVFGR